MKFGEISEDVKNVLDDVINKTDLTHYMNIYYYSVPKQKTVIKVSKLNPLGEIVAKKPDTVVITVLEAVFEKLTPNQQIMVAEDAISLINFDTEKEKISIDSPTISMSLGGWRKYGKELTEAYEACVLASQQLEEEEREAKAALQEARKANRKTNK